MPTATIHASASRAPLFEACAAIVIVALWAATLVPLLPVAASNPRLVEAFSTDEALQTNLIANALRNHTWRLQFGAYGHLYLNLCLAIQRLLPSWTTESIVVTARTISLASAMALLLGTFLWTRGLYGRAAAWLTLLLLLVNPTVYRWAAVFHPDMLQAALLLASLWLTARAFQRPTTASLLQASVASGLAFAAKYSGLLVLPLIAVAGLGRRIASGPGGDARMWIVRVGMAACAAILLAMGLLDAEWVLRSLVADGRVDVPLPVSIDTALRIMLALGVCVSVAVATPWLWRAMLRRRSVETTLWGMGVALTAFAATFVLASPYSLWKLAFLKGLYFEVAETGAVFNLVWVDSWLVGGGAAIGWTIVAACAGTVIWLLANRASRPLSNAEMVLISWLGLYIVVLLAPVHERLLHYTLPLIAPAAMLAACGIVSMTTAAMRNRPASWTVRAVPVSMALTLGLSVEVHDAIELMATRHTLLEREHSPVVLAGNWIADEIPASARIAYDYTSYIPPQFIHATATWGASPDWLLKLRPDFVVVNAAIESAWRGRPEAEAYYSCVKSGACGYRHRYSLDTFSVYERMQSTLSTE